MSAPEAEGEDEEVVPEQETLGCCVGGISSSSPTHAVT